MRLVLSGGGTSGILAHAAAMDALRGQNVPIEALGGVSAGAVVAALAATWDGDLETVARSLLCSGTPLESPAPAFIPFPQLYNGRGVLRGLKRVLPGTMSRARVPLTLVAANLTTQQQVVFDSSVHPAQSLAMAAYASMAVPFVFPPARIRGQLFVDGGVTSNVPSLDLYGNSPDVLVLRIVRREPPGEPSDPAGFVSSLLETMMQHSAESDTASLGAHQVIELPIFGDLVDFEIDPRVATRICNAARDAVNVWRSSWSL